MGALHFPYDPSAPCDSPEQTRNPEVCDVAMSDVVIQLALLLEDVFVMHGLGSVSLAHTGEDIGRLAEACASRGIALSAAKRNAVSTARGQ